MPAHAPESILTPKLARSLIRFAMLRTGSASCDDDLVQEALLRGLNAFRRTRHVENPHALFTKIVKDTVRDHWRRRRVFVSLEFVAPRDARYVLDFEGNMDRARRLSQIYAALRAMPARQQQLMQLFYFEELSIGELSLTLNKSRSALKMALSRIRAAIIDAIQRPKTTRRMK